MGRRWTSGWALSVATVLLAACAGSEQQPIAETANARARVVGSAADHGSVLSVEHGMASWYGPGFHGRLTASGEIFDRENMTAAHRDLPLPSFVRVTNLNNGRSVILRVNDRGPVSRDLVIDVSEEAAERLGFIDAGIVPVRVDVLDWRPAVL